jgi:hypothetical protein
MSDIKTLVLQENQLVMLTKRLNNAMGNMLRNSDPEELMKLRIAIQKVEQNYKENV